jgi:NitT/TauT family transport system ATP-binding protein
LLADRILVMTSRPGSIRESLDVPLARPRSLATLSEPAFQDLTGHIRKELLARPRIH